MGSNNSAQRGYNRPGYNQYQNYQHPYYGYRHPGYYGYQNALPNYSSYGLPTYGVQSTYAPLVSSYPSTYIPPTTSYTPSSYYPYSSNYVPPVSSYSVSRDLSAYSSYYPTYSAPLTGLPEYGISSLSAPLAIGYNSAPTYVNNYSLPPAYISTPSTTPLLGAPTYTSPTYTTPLSFSSPLNVVAPTYTTPAITAPTYTSTYAAPTYTSNYINPTLTTPLLDGTSSILPTSTTPFIPATVLGSLPTSTDFNYAIPRQGYTLENPSQLYQGNFWQVGAPSPLSADALTRIPSNYGLAPLQVPNSAIPETILGNRNTDAVAYTAEPTNDPEFEGQEHTTPNKDLKE